MQVLPITLSAAAALAVAPGLRQGLVDGGHIVQNSRTAQLPGPLGIIVVAAVALALGGLEAVYEPGLDDEPYRFVTLGPAFVLGAAALGLFDDVFGGPSPGRRGRGAAVRPGKFPTGLLKPPARWDSRRTSRPRRYHLPPPGQRTCWARSPG